MYTGQVSALDIDRLIRGYTCTSIEDGDSIHLAVHSKAVPVLEQILFLKMLFATSALEHHRVRAANAVFNKYFSHLRANEGLLPEKERFSTPSAFLSRTDAEWLHQDKPTGELASLSEALLNRNLPRRLMVVSSETMKSSGQFQHLQEAIKSPGFITHLEQSILDTVAPYSQGHSMTIRDIYVDLPAVPSLRESGRAVVLSDDGSPSSLSDFLPLTSITETFALRKWRGYVFANTVTLDQRLKTAKAAAETFAAEEFVVTDEAFNRARLSPVDVWAAY